MPAAAEAQQCKRCHAQTSAHILRSTPHCVGCYDHYIRSKCVKRMESYKIKSENPPITLLLALSFGASSTTLLHLLDSQIRAQKHRIRYRLKILHVDERILDPSLPASESLEEVKRRFPQTGGYLSARLEDVYDFAAEETGLERDGEDGGGKEEKLKTLLQRLPSPTSREDLAAVLRTRLIVALARREGCSGILWGDTTTRLADKVLASAAKGRGAQLPFEIGDGPGPFGITYYRPLRDVFKKELVTYISEIVTPPLLPLCVGFSSTPKHSAAAATSGKNITVGELMTQYFESMEAQYPSTVSNVVRMGDRLKLPGRGEEEDSCAMCGLLMDKGGNGLTLGAQEVVEGGERRKVCYGCMRATHGASAELSWPVLS
ncbi:hypothetical protein FN846DRAFT_930205 [Sphaerosporella brunnea]|uniref:Cytoplasmic tRNA 2-thiolation protein 2 n=1 Tax=Sphaerosporella brunnea TaxID=1250544 RepID=A0A5J5F870_9PEZI|nr:hypothetical protein FN846DRAFT_930205 [Sphaerosporella brunnea]